MAIAKNTKRKILFIGVTSHGAVSTTIRRTLETMKTSFLITCVGIGSLNDHETNGIRYCYLKQTYISSILIKIRTKFFNFFHRQTYILGWKQIYKQIEKKFNLNTFDQIIAVSGPFKYMKASFELSKKYNRNLELVFFDPFKSKFNSRQLFKATQECNKWCDYASRILYDIDSDRPIDFQDNKKILPFHIPIFETQIKQPQNEKKFYLYGGSFYKTFRNPQILIDFVRIHKDKNFYVFTDKQNGKFIRNKTCTNVKVFTNVETEFFSEKCQSCWAYLVLGNGDINYTIPSKGLEAIGHHKPIITLNFVNDTHYLKRYPFCYDGSGQNVFEQIEKISIEELNNFNIYENYPERKPELFYNLLFKESNI